MRKLVPILFLLSSCFFIYVVSHGGPTHVEFAPSEAQGNWQANWVIDEVDEVEYVTFTLKAKINGWVAIGFSGKEGTADSDVIIGYTGSVTDRYAKTDSMFNAEEDTKLGGTNDVTETSVEYKDSFTVVKCTRKVETGDIFDYNFFNDTLHLHIKWAYGEHGNEDATAYGEEMFDFFGTEDEGNEISQLKTHGILMVLVLMVLMPSGMVLSRYLKLIYTWWFYAHTAILFLAVFFMTTSAVIAFKAHGNNFVPGWHSVFGLLFIIGMGAQTILGVIAHLRFDQKRVAPPFFPDKIHWFLGRGMFFLGVLTVLIGLYALPARKLAKNAYYFWAVVIFFLILALEKHIGQTHEVASFKGLAEDDDAFTDDSDGDYTPKRGNSISRGHVEKHYSNWFLLKLLGPASFGIVLSFILVSVGIGTTEMEM